MIMKYFHFGGFPEINFYRWKITSCAVKHKSFISLLIKLLVWVFNTENTPPLLYVQSYRRLTMTSSFEDQHWWEVDWCSPRHLQLAHTVWSSSHLQWRKNNNFGWPFLQSNISMGELPPAMSASFGAVLGVANRYITLMSVPPRHTPTHQLHW